MLRNAEVLVNHLGYIFEGKSPYDCLGITYLDGPESPFSVSANYHYQQWFVKHVVLYSSGRIRP